MSKDKIKELLSVLDMSEEEQWKWINDYLEMEDFGNHRGRITIFDAEDAAHLAFRLRDEEERKGYLLQARMIIWVRKMPKGKRKRRLMNYWWVDYAHSIDWIIATLIAKELAKEN